MSGDQLGLVIDIGLIVAVIALALAGVAEWLVNHAINPVMQQALVALIGLLQARLGIHILAIKADQKAIIENGNGGPKPPEA